MKDRYAIHIQNNLHLVKNKNYQLRSYRQCQDRTYIHVAVHPKPTPVRHVDLAILSKMQ